MSPARYRDDRFVQPTDWQCTKWSLDRKICPRFLYIPQFSGWGFIRYLHSTYYPISPTPQPHGIITGENFGQDRSKMVQNIYNNNYRNQSSLLPHHLWGHITTYLRTADDKTPYNTVIILISHSEKIYRDLQVRYCPGTNDLCVILLSQLAFS